MNKYRKYIIIVVPMILIIGVYSILKINEIYDKDTVFSWCGLSNVIIKDDYGIESTGSMFTRGFEWSFKISPEDVKGWIDKSEGLKNPKEIKAYSEKHKLFIVNPMEGSTYGEVDIRYDTGEIRIKTYWS